MSVTVNDSQHDWAMQLLKAAGLPNSARPFASFSQRVHPPLDFGQLLGRTRHRTQARGIGHGAVLHEDKVPLVHGNSFGLPLPPTLDACYRERAVFGLAFEICHRAIRDQMDTLGFEPRLQGQNQGVVLVVDGSLDAPKRVNAGKLEHESMQVTLEFNGAVPRLEGKCSDPHVPEFRLEELRRKPVGNTTWTHLLFVGIAEFQQFETVLHGEPHRRHWNFCTTAVD